MYILATNWFLDLLRTFFLSIDKIVFGLISTIYELLIAISRTSVLSQADIIDVAERVYALLTIFMVFKVTFSLIMYTVNPDDFSDKTKGISKLGTNIIISLCLLILTPYIFSYAYQIQTIVLEDNAIAALIFGDDYDNTQNPMNTAGDKMAFIVMTPFFAPNLGINELYQCTQLTEVVNGEVKFNKECSGLNDKYEVNGSDAESMAALLPEKDEDAKIALQNYVVGIEMGNFDMLFREEIATLANDDRYLIDYKYLFSTALGIIVILLLVSFCMDVALRSVKLAFLQLIAPIPIISYVDPKSGKDGLFKKWYSMCFSTFLSLFIRLLALYFAVYIIDKIDRIVDVVDGSYVTSMWVKIFVIIGVLMFAKQLPKILEGLGIKLDGNGKFTLNPLRKLENEAMGGKFLKKPNDWLAKAGKAVAMSPIKGAGTFAKKRIAGLDSLMHGGSYKAGKKSVKGGIAKGYDKFLEKNLPMAAERRKKKQKAEIDELNRGVRASKGENMGTKVNSSLDALARGKVNPKTNKHYKSAAEWKAADKEGFSRAQAEVEAGRFTNPEFKSSYLKVANAKLEANKKADTARELNQKYQAVLNGNGVEYGGKWYGAQEGKEFEAYKRKNGGIVQLGDTSELSSYVNSADAAAKSASGKLEMAKKEHETMRSKYERDANLETAYDEFGKFNTWDDGMWNPPSDVETQETEATQDTEEETDSENHDTSNETSEEKQKREADEQRRRDKAEYEKNKLRDQIEVLQRNLEAEETKAKGAIKNWQTVISSLEQSLASAEDDERIAKLTQEIERYRTEIEIIENNLNELRERTEGQIRNLEDQIAIIL